MTVVVDTAAAGSSDDRGAGRVGSAVPVKRTTDGTAYIAIRNLPPSEVLVPCNHPGADEGSVNT